MPTGYTADVEEKDISFPEFLWRCVRAFGYFMHMRDDGLGAQLRYPEENRYYQDQLREYEKELKQVQEMSVKDIETKIRRDAEADRKYRAKQAGQVAEANARLSRMAASVEAWEPPGPDYQGLKDFMLNQLDISLHSGPDSRFTEPVPPTVEEYRAKEIRFLEDQVASYREKAAEEIKFNATARKWIDDLRASVPPPKGAFR